MLTYSWGDQNKMCEKCNLDLIKSNILVENIEFSNLYYTKRKDKLIGQSKDKKFFIKIQNIKIKHLKLNTLKEESEIFQYLTKKESVCTPKYFFSNFLSETNYFLNGQQSMNDTYFYLIVENIEGSNSKIDSIDLEISLLELMNFGIFYSDLKSDNLIFDSNKSICFIVDHDQSRLSWGIEKNLKDKVKLLREFKYEITGFKKLEKNLDLRKKQRLFKNNRLDLDSSSLVRSQKSSNVKSGHYHQISSEFFKLTGVRSSKAREKLLNNLNFSQDENIVDMGCNLGLVCQVLSARGLSVTGIEIDSSTLSLARFIRNIEGYKYNLIQNFNDFLFVPNQKNTLILFSVLHHVRELDVFVKWVNNNFDRIIIECREYEIGKQNVDNQWLTVQEWDFHDESNLLNYLLTLFSSFSKINCIGNSDKGRKIYEITR
jgi:hypothetical protein